MTPSRPETGYGYIKRGKSVAGFSNLFEVAAFVEKPNRDNAVRFLESGDHYWNSGMFLFSAKSFLSELERYAPDVLSGVRRAVAERSEDGDFVRLGTEAFSHTPPISIDYAVMEKSANVVTIPCDIGWTDVGSWSELWNVSEKDERGNVTLGDAIVLDSRNTYVRGENQLVAASGLEDIILVATKDAVLAVNRNAAQDIRPIVEQLNRARRSEAIDHINIQQSWGVRRLLMNTKAARVRQLTINPGKGLSVQRPTENTVHLVVIEGAPVIGADQQRRAMSRGQSLDIATGTRFTIENPSSALVDVIEIQNGPGFRDDDIVSL
jgi:mannose-1-phosphate guanylyltransferase/mannose-1-phosphate guanylyltransferase/mannose-6-phosphate isomerase